MMNKKVAALIVACAAVAAALTACVCALAYFGDKLAEYYEAGKKLYLHERKVRGHEFKGTEPDPREYGDLDFETTGV